MMENLRHSTHWRLAVWGVRVTGPGLAVVMADLVTLVWSTATGKAIVAVGIGQHGQEGTVTTGPCAWLRTAWMTAPGPW